MFKVSSKNRVMSILSVINLCQSKSIWIQAKFHSKLFFGNKPTFNEELYKYVAGVREGSHRSYLYRGEIIV